MANGKEFFSLLDTRFAVAGEKTVIWLSIYGYSVKLVFAGIVPNEIIRLNLGLFISSPVEHADETVFLWEDSLECLMASSMVPFDKRHIHYHQGDGYRISLHSANGRLTARDETASKSYICFENGFFTPEACAAKPFTNEIQWWLHDRFLLIHGALVGTNGTGALITAPSGRGKSTLALAALLSGLEYVSEDYTLVTRSGQLVGYPTFPTGYLKPDTLEMLPAMREHIVCHMAEKDKFIVDLTSFDNFAREGLEIRALILPVICDSATPQVISMRSVAPFMDAVSAAAKQVRLNENVQESFKAIFSRLKAIRSYEMLLTDNPLRNADALREFLVQLGETYENE